MSNPITYTISETMKILINVRAYFYSFTLFSVSSFEVVAVLPESVRNDSNHKDGQGGADKAAASREGVRVRPG